MTHKRPRLRPIVVTEEYSRRTIVLDDDGDYPAFVYLGPEPDHGTWGDFAGLSDDPVHEEIPGEPLIAGLRRPAA